MQLTPRVLSRAGSEGATPGPKSGRCYRLVPHNPPLTPNDCADLCGDGSLASISDASEQSEIDELILHPPAEAWSGAPPQYAWIGAYSTKPMYSAYSFSIDQWAWADGAVPADGRDSSKCTSMGNDCCAPGEEAQTCADGFVAVQLDDSQSQFPRVCPGEGGWYTCCPPGEDACGTAFANWAPPNMPACDEERCAWTVPQAFGPLPQAGWYSWPCAQELDGVAASWAATSRGACVCTDAPPAAAYLNATEPKAEPNCENCPHDPSKCREFDPHNLDSDCCGMPWETWCADGYVKVHGTGPKYSCEGQKGYTCRAPDSCPSECVSPSNSLLDDTCEPVQNPGESPIDAYPAAVSGVCLVLTLIVIATFIVYPAVSNVYEQQPEAAAALVEEGGAAKNKRVDTDALTGLRGVAAMHVAIGHHFQVRLLPARAAAIRGLKQHRYCTFMHPCALRILSSAWIFMAERPCRSFTFSVDLSWRLRTAPSCSRCRATHLATTARCLTATGSVR